MSITFQCYSCQKVLRVGEDKAGKKAKCAQCGTILTIPMASAEEEVVGAEVEAEPEPRPRPRPSRDDDDLDDDVPPRPRRKRDDDYDDRDDDDDRPRSRRRGRADDDDDDRPRSRRRDRADDDDDDRPRSRRGRDDDYDDYDDDDDRPRRRHRDDDDDWDRPRRSGSGTSSWPKVRVGLLLAFIGFCVMAGGYGLEGVGILLFHTGSFRASQIVSAIGTIIEVGGLITAVVGYVFWVFVNNKFGLLAFGISALAVNGVSLIFQIINRLVPAFNAFGRGGLGGLLFIVAGNQLFIFHGGMGAAIVGIILSQALTAACFIMPAFYLIALGKNFKDRSLTGKGNLLVILSGVSAGASALASIIIISMFSGANAGSGARIVMVILQILTFGLQNLLYVMFIVALHYARGTVE